MIGDMSGGVEGKRVAKASGRDGRDGRAINRRVKFHRVGRLTDGRNGVTTARERYHNIAITFEQWRWLIDAWFLHAIEISYN